MFLLLKGTRLLDKNPIEKKRVIKFFKSELIMTQYKVLSTPKEDQKVHLDQKSKSLTQLLSVLSDEPIEQKNSKHIV